MRIRLTGRFTRNQLIGAALVVVLLAGLVSYKLLAGSKDSSAAESDIPKVAILSSGSGASFDDALKGIAVGFEGHPADFTIEYAGNDPAEARALAQKLLADEPDILIALGAQAAQVAADVNAGRPLVVAGLANPFGMGLAASEEQHRPDLTGVYSSEPVEGTIGLVRELYPAIAKIAIVYDPTNAESLGYLQDTRLAAAAQGLILQEVPLPTLPLLDTSRKPLEGKALDEAIVGKVMAAIPADVQLIYLPRDWMVLDHLDSLSKQAALRNIPVVTNDPATIGTGCLAALGDEYVSVGREAGRQALSILAGTKPADIPFLAENSVILVVNHEVAQKLQYTFPSAIELRATRFFPGPVESTTPTP